ncbi:MAG: F0F1 ATP synthase subunit B, partial [Pseudomonadota bacterium]
MLVMLAEGVGFFANPDTWVGFAFLVFVGGLIYYGIPGMIGKALDARSDRIRKELDEARRLREEAQQLLADYQRKTATAETEAQEIIARAETEAKALAEETRKSLQDSLERRTRAAEEKIARSEAQAVAEVRSTAVERAVAAAEQIMRDRLDGNGQSKLIDDAIADLP